MSASPSPRLHRAAARLRVAAIASAALLVLVTVAAVLGPFPGSVLSPELYADGLPRSWAATIAVVVATLAAMGLLSISRMLSCVSRSEIFSVRAVSHFRRFALYLLLAALMQVVLPAAATLLLAFQRHGGEVTLSIDVGDVLALFLAIVFYFVSRLFAEASRLDEDNRSIV